MGYPRELPLLDSGPKQLTWNERMGRDEYAVHYSSFQEPGAQPYCTVFGNLQDAVNYAESQVEERPALRCTIYDSHGLAGAPVREIKGKTYKGPSDISPRFRRWAGSILFFGGVGLTALDWSQDFRMSWPAMIGTRMLIPGLTLLVIEALIALHTWHSRRKATREVMP